MSQIKLDNVAAILPIEPFSAETGLLQILSTGTNSFDNHLQRAQSRPDEPNAAVGEAESMRRPDDVRSDDREDSAPVEPQAEATEESSPDRPAEDAPAEADGSEQPAAEDTGDSTETHPDELPEEPSEEDTEAKPSEVPVGGQLVDTLPGEATGEATSEQPVQTTSDSQDNAGSRRGPQDLVPEQDNVVQQSPADGASGRVVAEVKPEATAPVAEEKVLLQTTVETTGAAAEKSDKPADEASEESEKAAQPGDKKASGAVEQIEQHTAETDRAAEVAASTGGEVLPAETPQSPRRSRGKKDPVVEGNDGSLAHRVAAKPAATSAVATLDAQMVATEAVAASEVRAEPAVNTGGTASNDAAGSQEQTSIRDGAAASKGPQQAAGGDGVDRVRFVQRVARAFEAIGGRSRIVRLRLSPPELGSLRLEVTVRNGVMNARVEAETATARNLLLDNLGSLRDRLALQDIKIEQFTVDLMGRSPGGPHDGQAGQTQGQDGDWTDDLPRPNADAETSEQTEPIVGAVNRPGEGTQLNVVI